MSKCSFKSLNLGQTLHKPRTPNLSMFPKGVSEPESRTGWEAGPRPEALKFFLTLGKMWLKPAVAPLFGQCTYFNRVEKLARSSWLMRMLHNTFFRWPTTLHYDKEKEVSELYCSVLT